MVGEYEAHITIFPGDAILARKVAAENGFDFSFSQIHGDEVLGDRLWAYCSTTRPTIEHDEIHSFVRKLKESGVMVIRVKIEHIVYDERFTYP